MAMFPSLPFSALVTHIDPDRAARAKNVSSRLLYMNTEAAEFRGESLASTPGDPPYEVRLNAKEETAWCSCQDFHRHLMPCKHLISFGKVCKAVLEGFSP